MNKLMNRLKKRTEKHVPRFVYKKINKQLVSVAGSVLIVLGSYAVVPVQVLATETATEAETTQVQQSNTTLPTVASSELSSETQPTTTNEEPAAQETPRSTTDDAKAPKETEPKPADETKKSEETDQQADTAKTRAQPQPRANTINEGWEYYNRGTYVEIKNYSGDLVDITVPAKIDGLPVEINLGTVLKEKMANENEAVTETFKIESAGEGEKPVELVGSFKDLFALLKTDGTYYDNNKLISVDFGNADCSDIEDLSDMFNSCIELKAVNVTGWDTSRVKDMEHMFYGCRQLQELDVSDWDTSQVKDMQDMFVECSQLQELDVSGWDTSRVKDMEHMFYGCRQLQELDVSDWDTSQVKDMQDMFVECSQLQELDVSGWDTSRVKHMEYMFYGCSRLQEIDVSGWKTSQVQDMSDMFQECSQLQELDVSGWDTSQVQYMVSMFQKCSQLQKLDLSGWDTSQVQNMGYMFQECTQLQKLDLSGWKTSRIQDMSDMFSDSNNLSKLTLSSDFEFQLGHNLRELPDNTGETAHQWVKDNYAGVYDSTENFTTAHNNLTEIATNHVYTIQKKYKVSFDLNNGSGKTPDPQFVFEGNLADNPDYEGIKGDLFFDGWTLNSVPFTFDKPITEPVELVASWRKAKYTIEFDPNGGVGTMNEQVLSVDEELSLSANSYTRQGYDFDGWNKESDGGGKSYSDKEAVKNLLTTEGEQVKLYAQWKPITYTINFDSKNGSSISPKTYTIETGIDSFETPTRLGYTFEGWYEGKTKVTKIETGETGNRKLEAKWMPVTYQVTFDSAGGNAIDPITFTTEIPVDKLPQPVRIGYRFLGWYDGDTKVTELPKGTIGDKILTAKWEKIKTTEVIEDILKEENQKNRKEQDYTEDSWKNYQEAKKAAEELLKEVNPDPLKAEQVLAKLQAAIQGLTLKNVAEPTPSIEKPTNIPTSKKVYPTSQAKQYPRMNMVTTIWPCFIGTGLVAAVIALIKKNKK